MNAISKLTAYALFPVLIVATYSSANAECSITFGGDARSRTETSNGSKDIYHIGGRWEFIRSTRGPCSFRVYNQEQLRGSSAVYGSGISQRIRIGSKGAQDKNGWKGRSVAITKNSAECSITLGDSGARQTFYGPSKIDDITGWDFVNRTQGNCIFSVYNNSGFSGASNTFHEGVSERRRVGYRIRSVIIKEK